MLRKVKVTCVDFKCLTESLQVNHAETGLHNLAWYNGFSVKIIYQYFISKERITIF